MLEQCDFTKRNLRPRRTGRVIRRIWSCGCPAASRIVDRLQGADRRVSRRVERPVRRRTAGSAEPARAPGARTHPHPRRKRVLEAVSADARVRRHVPAPRAAARGGVRTGRHAARTRRQPPRDSGDADDASGRAEGGRLRVEAGTTGGERRGDPPDRPRALRAAGNDGRAPRRRRAEHQTGRGQLRSSSSARSNRKCSRAHGASRSSA